MVSQKKRSLRLDPGIGFAPSAVITNLRAMPSAASVGSQSQVMTLEGDAATRGAGAAVQVDVASAVQAAAGGVPAAAAGAQVNDAEAQVHAAESQLLEKEPQVPDAEPQVPGAESQLLLDAESQVHDEGVQVRNAMSQVRGVGAQAGNAAALVPGQGAAARGGEASAIRTANIGNIVEG